MSILKQTFMEIDQLKQQIATVKPLSAELQKTINQKFTEEWTYHSNAIEGNTMSQHETAFFLREGLTIKGKSLREHLEVINHLEAIEYLQDAIHNRSLTESLIKSLHAMIFQGVKFWS